MSGMRMIIYQSIPYHQAKLEEMTSKELIDLYNQVTEDLAQTMSKEIPQVRRFSDHDAAVKRTLRILERYEELVGRDATVVKKTKPVSRLKSLPKNVQRKRGINYLPPGFTPKPCKAGTKQSILVDYLSGPRGASMKELLSALAGGRKPWTETSIYSGFGCDLKQKGYGVRSVFEDNGEERFILVLPQGFSVPQHKSK